MAEARIDVVIGSAQAQSGANAVNRAVDGIKSNFLDMSAKVFVAQQALSRVWGSATQGAQFEETMGRLNRQMGNFHSTAQLMVNDLQAISNGTVSVDRTAMMASRALAVGLNPDQIKTFVQAADSLEDVMGTDLPTAFDSLVQAALTGRSAVLANIGVYVDLDEEAKKLAVSTGRTTDQITKQEKAMLAAKAITSQAGDALHKLSDGALSDADRLKQVEARWQNLWTTIGLGAKTTVIESLDWLEELGKKLDSIGFTEERAKKIVKAIIDPRGAQRDEQRAAQYPMPAGILQSQEPYGPWLPTSKGEPPKPMPTALRGSQLQAAQDLKDKSLQGDFDRTKAMLDAKSALYDTDVQRQILTAEDVATFKATLQLQELAKQGETLSKQLQGEETFHRQRVKIGFESTEERISEDERYRSKVFDLHQALLTNAQAFGIQSDKNDADRAVARDATEKALGERTAAHFKSNYDISESLRKQDLDDAQLYYQGELDMANARFASDEEIAQKERYLLREQLAFKLRLSQEETNRLLFLRQSNDFQGVRDVLAGADPTLSARAKEGITESAAANDRILMERANGDFFAGWKRGLQDYSKHRDDAFGMSQVMARETAQAMEQGFQKFFFDGMDGKFKGFKDVLTGVLDFTKQIVSQMAAQMMTVGIIKPGASALSMLFGGGSKTPADVPLTEDSIGAKRFGGIERFAMGGITSRPRMMALGGRLVEYGEGPQAEAFVPLPDGRTIPVTMRFAGAMPQAVSTGGGPISITMPVNIINQHEGAQVETRQSTGANGMPQLDVLIMKAVNKGIAEGRTDKTMRARFGITPGER